MMRIRRASAAGFSLIEVTLTLAVVAFAMIGILGVLPIAFQESRSVVDETRAAQLARHVFGTLESEPFEAARCFGTESDPKLDLSLLDESSGPVLLFAIYDVRAAVTVVRADTPPAAAAYQIELRFEKVTDPDNLAVSASSGPAAEPALRGNMVRLKIVSIGSGKTTVFTGAHFFHRLKQGSPPR